MNLLRAISLLTIFPCEPPSLGEGDWGEGDLSRDLGHDLGRATPYFPLVGALIGGILVVVDLAAAAAFSLAVRAALILIASALVTGGLHLDGLADTFDGLFSRAERDRALEIMRESRIGALGAAGLVLYLLLKYALLADLVGGPRAPILFLMPVSGRLAMVAVIMLYPYARSGQGLGRAFAGRVGRRDAVLSLTFTALVLVPAVAWLGDGRGVWYTLQLTVFPMAAALLFTLLVARGVAARLGGLTGDTYGATNELAEMVFLFSSLVAGKVWGWGM